MNEKDRKVKNTPPQPKNPVNRVVSNLGKLGTSGVHNIKNFILHIDIWAIVTIVIILIICFSFYNKMIKPTLNRIDSLNSQISQTEQKLNVLLLAQEKLPSLEQDINNCNNIIASLQSMLPAQDNEFLFIEEFMMLCNINHAQINSLNLSKLSGSKKPFTLSCNIAQYEDLLNFLAAIKDNYPQIITFTKMSLSSNAKTGFVVNVEGSINLFQGGGTSSGTDTSEQNTVPTTPSTSPTNSSNPSSSANNSPSQSINEGDVFNGLP